MKKAGIGIIGFGYIGSVHLRHLLKLPDVKYVAVSDISKKALNDASSYGAIKTYSDYHELLKDQNIDAVIVALPTHLHLECASQAAEAGKHIFLEKPIARNPGEAKDILSVTEKNAVKLMMGYHLRFDESFLKLKEKVDQGELGDVEIAFATFVGSGPFFHRGGHTPVPVPEWWFNKELTGGGALIDVGSHMINLLRWYFGEINDIKGSFGHRFNFDFEDSALCQAKFESGTTAVINAGYFSQGFRLEVEMFGSVENGYACHHPGSKIRTALKMLATGKNKFYQAHLDEIKHFVNCLVNDTVPSPSGLDGLRDIEAISKAYASQMY
jgi:myo-inositol 2-dehydrogenase / D-chiro-inositol 1-dehydrogenase